jgi:hypothetical protein
MTGTGLSTSHMSLQGRHIKYIKMSSAYNKGGFRIGDALMPTKGKGAARLYLQSERNLALADENLGLAQHLKSKHLVPI